MIFFGLVTQCNTRPFVSLFLTMGKVFVESIIHLEKGCCDIRLVRHGNSIAAMTSWLGSKLSWSQWLICDKAKATGRSVTKFTSFPIHLRFDVKKNSQYNISQQLPLSLKTRPMFFAPNLKIPSLLAELMRKGKVLKRHLQSEVFGKFISAKRGHGKVKRTFVAEKINMRSKKSKQDYF